MRLELLKKKRLKSENKTLEKLRGKAEKNEGKKKMKKRILLKLSYFLIFRNKYTVFVTFKCFLLTNTSRLFYSFFFSLYSMTAYIT